MNGPNLKSLRLLFWLIAIAGFFAFSVRSAAAWTDQEYSDFQTANAAYRESDFKKARDLYEGLTEKNFDVDALHYNLGNVYHRLKKKGRAILSYERALAINPRNSDARKNLEYVNSLLEYRVEDKRNWYLKAAENLLGYISEREVVLAALGCLFLFLLSLTVSLYSEKSLTWDLRTRVFSVLMSVMLIIFLAKMYETRVSRDAIIVKNNAEVRYGPSESDQVAFRLGEGLKVTIADDRNEWSRVTMVSGESGWIKNSLIEKVMP